MQNQISSERELLDDNGQINGEGYATAPLWRYRRAAVRAPWFRIKEWDYYAVIDQESGFGVTLTASDLGYAGLYAICVVNLKTGSWHQVDTMSILPAGRSGFAETADADHTLSFTDNTLSMTIDRSGDTRRLAFSCDRFKWPEGAGLEGEILLTQPPKQERMVIATSWEKKRTAFYYNQKINCMPASGFVRTGDSTHKFCPGSSFGVLDWGRGNWTYRNRWYWGSASGMIDGSSFGFNLGYGFSDRSPASENMLFYNGTAHKLEQINFTIDTSDYLKPWLVTSSDSRFEMRFDPVLDRYSATNLLLIKSIQHQCFGYYSGRAVLDNGEEIRITGFPGFAEDVFNRW